MFQVCVLLFTIRIFKVKCSFIQTPNKNEIKYLLIIDFKILIAHIVDFLKRRAVSTILNIKRLLNEHELY